MKGWLSFLEGPLRVLPASQLLLSCLSSLGDAEPSGLYPCLVVLVSLSQVSAPRHTVFSLKRHGRQSVVVGGGRSSPLAKKEGLWLPARTFCPM